MVRRFTDRFEAGFPALESLNCNRISMTLVTSVLGAGFIRPMAERLNRIPWLTAHVVEVKNRFLGEGITVSGLLTGEDMLHALKTQWRETDVVVLPPNCISHHGLFLDNLTPNDLEQALKCRFRVWYIRSCRYDGSDRTWGCPLGRVRRSHGDASSIYTVASGGLTRQAREPFLCRSDVSLR